jgi:hypothetical protein
VIVTDIKMPFWSLVKLLVEWAIAAMPALIILYVLAFLLTVALRLAFGLGAQYWPSLFPTY